MFEEKYNVVNKGSNFQSTLASIFTQIATHYHTYEIARPYDVGRKTRATRSNHGYFMEHLEIDNSSKTEALFPTDEFFWVTSVREPVSYLYSYIKFNGWQRYFAHENFSKTLVDYNEGKLPRMKGAFVSSLCDAIFRPACRDKDDNNIRECNQGSRK